ncbi:MarR family transcriptional regulator [Methanolobus sp. ZRKC3]|uniref:MarR family winged helix-turn-helix transcriptional regulator n=1 Tax=Methanolobus sp. ZRKC3 TaxID=3125786 RepID=UPI003248CDDC
MNDLEENNIDRHTIQESIGKYTSHLFRSIQIYVSKELEPYGIGSGQFPFIMRLLHCDGIKQEELASCLKYDRATITRSMNKLEEMGYVSRERDPDDRRAYMVCLTEKGRAMEPVIKDVSSQLNDVLLRGFTEEETMSFISMLMRTVDNISSENEARKVMK